MPGALPVINKKAIEYVVRAALALNCEINLNPKFDRKNYFYPDLPKGYQISEYDAPIGANGWLEIEVNGQTKRVHIQRVHLEEDTGKLFHVPGDEVESFVDLNRSGVPLMEIVTKFPPDIHTAEEARAYLVKLRAILTYINVCDGKMQEGSLRCEPNVSIRPQGSDTFGTKTEIKNLNSFRAVQRGIEYEVARQIIVVTEGGEITQETRGWDEVKQVTYSQRSKEGEQEYRYFPEPDLVPLQFEATWVEEVRASMLELPDARKARFMSDYALPLYDAEYLTQERALADYFEATAKLCRDPKMVSNWVMGDLSRLLNANGKGIINSPVSPAHLATMLEMISDGSISGKMAKTLLEAMYVTGEDPNNLAEKHGLKLIKDSDALSELVDRIVTENPVVVADIKERAMLQKRAFLIGQVMKESKGTADPKEVNRLLDERLSLNN
jgi:aspartyl-tRNA(Asn)/glutamyl-tRNA(Gln) amidotransferase subunit B